MGGVLGAEAPPPFTFRLYLVNMLRIIMKLCLSISIMITNNTNTPFQDIITGFMLKVMQQGPGSALEVYKMRYSNRVVT